jgi:putative nucleotidyltransferase with HDIG domain
MQSSRTFMATSRSTLRSSADEVRALPVRPDVAAKLVWLVEDRCSTPGDLSRAMSVDPVLTIELLGYANSLPMHARETITSVARAVAMIGRPAIGAIAARAALSLFRNTRDDQDEFWSHALATAVSSAAVARATDRDPALPYTLGLIHDIGAVLVHQGVAEGHELIGARALRAAGVPNDLCLAVAYHHAPESRDAPAGAGFIAAGDALARYLEHGDRRPMVDAFAALGLTETVADRAAVNAQRDLMEIDKYLRSPLATR